MQISTPIQAAIRQKIVDHFSNVQQLRFHSVGGGSINEGYRVSFGANDVFCKINSASAFPQLFQKEKNGLERMARQGLIKTPSVIDCFEEGDVQVLLMEWVRPGERTETFWKTFGERLASFHGCGATFFGLEEDNYMGGVPQSNKKHRTWTAFFENERLRPMAERCLKRGLITQTQFALFDKLYPRLTALFEEETPSLLHGDLWSGNFMCDQQSEPVLIDPAVYYGHRSMDLAMTTLFGGFRRPFYEACHHHFPFPKNYEEQWAVCNLYPLLIHLYLFGSAYLPQIENTLRHFT